MIGAYVATILVASAFGAEHHCQEGDVMTDTCKAGSVSAQDLSQEHSLVQKDSFVQKKMPEAHAGHNSLLQKKQMMSKVTDIWDEDDAEAPGLVLTKGHAA